MDVLILEERVNSMLEKQDDQSRKLDFILAQLVDVQIRLTKLELEQGRQGRNWDRVIDTAWKLLTAGILIYLGLR